MLLPPEVLRRYLRYGHHEVLLTTVDSAGRVNTAPMGVDLASTESQYIVLKPYVNTATYSNLIATREAVVNVTSDALLYYYSLLKPEKLAYTKSKRVRPPRVTGSVDLYLECIVGDVRPSSPERAVIMLKPVYSTRGPGSGLAFSRANALLIEALVQYTKLPILISMRRADEARRRLEVVAYAYEVVRKVGSADVVNAIEDVYARCLGLMRTNGLT